MDSAAAPLQGASRPRRSPAAWPGDYHQVDQFFAPQDRPPHTADPATAPAQPRKSDLYDLFDFHKMISALGNYPELLVAGPGG